MRHPAIEEWFATLGDVDRAQVAARVDYLAENGPAARRPMVGKIEASRHANMKELIVPGNIRILFAFDPKDAGGAAGRRGQDPPVEILVQGEHPAR